MTEPTHDRWGASGMDPTPVTTQTRYEARPSGPVRRAPLLDENGLTLGWVWTDDVQAAGWVEPSTSPSAPGEGRARVRAAGVVWPALARAAARGLPAADVLTGDLVGPLYRLGPVETADTPTG